MYTTSESTVDSEFTIASAFVFEFIIIYGNDLSFEYAFENDYDSTLTSISAFGFTSTFDTAS